MLYKIAAASALVFSADALRVRGWTDNLKKAASTAMSSSNSDSKAKTGKTKTGGWTDSVSKATGVSADKINSAVAYAKGAMSSSDSDSNSNTGKTGITMSKEDICKMWNDNAGVITNLSLTVINFQI